MRLATLFFLIAAPALAADGFGTLPEYQKDFDAAVACQPMKDGRRVWKGRDAFYIQSWLFYTGQSGALDEESTDAVIKKDNPPETVAMFEEQCK